MNTLFVGRLRGILGRFRCNGRQKFWVALLFIGDRNENKDVKFREDGTNGIPIRHLREQDTSFRLKFPEKCSGFGIRLRNRKKSRQYGEKEDLGKENGANRAQAVRPRLLMRPFRTDIID